MLGGSPLRLFRLTDAGAALMERVRRGAPFDASTGEQQLLERWIDAGLLHPEPTAGSGPFTAADVTVVVPVRDRPAGLARLLDSLAESATPGVGVIVVDDGSLDPAALDAVIDVVGAARPVRLVRRASPGGPAAARNEGCALVRTPLVAFLDSDCRVDPGWLDPLLAQFGDPVVAIVAPRVRAEDAVEGAVERHAAPSTLERYERSRSPLDMGASPGRVAPGTRISYVPSAALVARVDALRELGGFDLDLQVGEDVDLIWRAVSSGRRVRYVPSTGVRHQVRSTFGAWVHQRVGYGRSAAALDARHPGQVAPVVISPWSAAVWALAAAGQPLLAAGLAVGTTAQLRRKLPDVSSREVVRLALGGHLGAGRQFAHAAVRVWWPLALTAALVSRRGRQVVACSVVWTVLDSWRHRGDHLDRIDPLDHLDPVRFATLTLLDDTSYGAGVWAGCWRARSIRSLLPRFTTSAA